MTYFTKLFLNAPHGLDKNKGKNRVGDQPTPY